MCWDASGASHAASVAMACAAVANFQLPRSPIDEGRPEAQMPMNDDHARFMDLRFEP